MAKTSEGCSANLSLASSLDTSGNCVNCDMRNLTGCPKHEHPAPVIRPAEQKDIPAIVQVTMEAQRSSAIYFFVYPSVEDERKAAEELITILERVWEDPRLCAMVGVAETGEVAAVALWQLKGYGLGTTDSVEKLRDLSSLRHFHRGTRFNKDKEKNSDNRDKFGNWLQDQLEAFFSSWTDNTKHIYLNILMTAPKFQRRGFGTALLEWGHKRADDDGVPAFLIASAVGHPLYVHKGWKEVNGTLPIDMNYWVTGGQTHDQGWGLYRFYYMLRMPLTAVGK